MSTIDPTKQRILEAAGAEFAEKGFELSRIRTICEKAEANVAAANYHFGDKKQLYIAAVLEAHRCGGEYELPAELPDLPAGTLLRMFIRQFLVNVLSIAKNDTWQSALMLREMLRPTEACAVLVEESIRPRFEFLRSIIRKAAPDVDDQKLNAICFSVIGQCLHYKMAKQVAERLIGREAFEALGVDYLTDHISHFCLAAMGLEPPLGHHVPSWTETPVSEDLTVS